MEDNLKITGELDIFINGELIAHVNNLVVTAGKTHIKNRMKAASEAVMSHIAIGTGTNAAALGNTTLQTEVARVAFNDAPVIADGKITYETTFGVNIPNSAKAITEAGIFNNDTAGTMLSRAVFAAIGKETTDIMTIKWAINTN